MNFKLLILLFFFSSACGIKLDPIPPKENPIPEYYEKFLKKEDKKK